MKEFKFLTPINIHPQGRFFSGDRYSGIRYGNGDVITIQAEQLNYGINRLQYPSFIVISFRWVTNFNASQMLSTEIQRTNSEDYEGPIDGFYRYYNDRRNYPHRQSILPAVPVIQRIECNGSAFYSESLAFNNPTQHVKIRYKKFYERV